MRPRIVAGNWKMNTTRETARQLAQEVAQGATAGVTVVVCPPYPYLEAVGTVLKGSSVALGAQDCHYQEKGAYTGSVSPAMLADMCCAYVLVGHSERRHGLQEGEGLLQFKVAAAVKAGLTAVLCVGETLEEREAKRIEQVLARHVSSGLAALSADKMGRLVIAYEPVWAIGTGKVATPEQAQEAHAFIRGHLRTIVGHAVADATPILYGGSVTGDNAANLFAQPDIDGGLIGGASLKPTDFLKIVAAAKR